MILKSTIYRFSSVQETAKQETEAPLLAGVETLIWTVNMLPALDSGVKGGKWFRNVHGITSRSSNAEFLFQIG